MNKKTPPLPAEKPATYDNESKGKKANMPIGNRQSKRQPDNDGGKDPQKTREKLEQDPTKKERDPGMTKK